MIKLITIYKVNKKKLQCLISNHSNVKGQIKKTKTIEKKTLANSSKVVESRQPNHTNTITS
jgi:hypothetical protein